MITLTFNNVTTEIYQTTEGLYRLNDIHKASGDSSKHQPNYFKEYSNSRNFGSKIISKGGRYGGSYADEKTVYKYAAWIDDSFYDVVLDAFKELVNGNQNKATDIALSVAVSQEIINKEKALRVTMNDLIKEKLGGGHYYSTYSKLACKCISGYIPSSLTGKNGSAFSYLIEQKHVDGAGAYLAALEMIVMSLKAGIDYHQCAAMMQVETGKNKHLFK